VTHEIKVAAGCFRWQCKCDVSSNSLGFVASGQLVPLAKIAKDIAYHIYGNFSEQ
jgi:hypothetical protein